jgi:hypothetical protein
MQEQEQKPVRHVGTNEQRAARLDEITAVAKQISEKEALMRQEKSRRLRAARLALSEAAKAESAGSSGRRPN